MIPLGKSDLSSDTLAILQSLQNDVDTHTPFEAKVNRAQSLWNSKTGSQSKKKAFFEVKTTLERMCVSVEVCNYCEQNEANDIEHIYPKSFFPGKTFEWANYLLACKQCNTAYKLDAFAVLDVHDNIVPLVRNSEPLYQEGAFINPRTENPNKFMLLNLSSFKFELLPDIDKRGKNKATKIIEILQLNERDTLIQARKSSAKYFYHRMDLLLQLLKAKSIQEIEELLTPYDNAIDNSQPIEQIKNDIKEGFKKDIISHQHPSVWHAIKVIQSKMDVKWKKLFEELPEALKWAP